MRSEIFVAVASQGYDGANWEVYDAAPREELMERKVGAQRGSLGGIKTSEARKRRWNVF